VKRFVWMVIATTLTASLLAVAGSDDDKQADSTVTRLSDQIRRIATDFKNTTIYIDDSLTPSDSFRVNIIRSHLTSIDNSIWNFDLFWKMKSNADSAESILVCRGISGNIAGCAVSIQRIHEIVDRRSNTGRLAVLKKYSGPLLILIDSLYNAVPPKWQGD
jgi:hypothetical protein